MRRRRLRTRLLVLTGAFAVALFAITFGLSWRARRAEQRWSQLIGVETRAIGALDELIRSQNAVFAEAIEEGRGGTALVARYRIVSQLLDTPALRSIALGTLRGRVKAFATILSEPDPRPEDLESTSVLVVREAQRIADERKREIARTLPELEYEADSAMTAGLAVAWIVVLINFAIVQTTLRKVVRPLEDLARAADRIASGDLAAHARVAGDYEIARLATALNGMADELRARARTDELTGLPNFRAFCERIDAEIERAARYPSSFGVLVLDLDHFKKYNDTFGHLAGNDALQRVALALRETVRTVDFAARYGGEEFAVIVPEVDVEALYAIAERIRISVESIPAPEGGKAVTVSIGASIFPLDGGASGELFHAADERLYAAKHAGRNRVVVPAPSMAPA